MKSNAVVKMIALFVLVIFAIIGVISLFDNSDSSGDGTDQQLAETPDNDGPTEFIQGDQEEDPLAYRFWAEVNDPVQLGSAVSTYLDRDGLTAAKQKEIDELSVKLDEEQLLPVDDRTVLPEELTKLIDERNAIRHGAYISPDERKEHLSEDQQKIYNDWVDEYYDSSGEQIKDFPIPDGQ